MKIFGLIGYPVEHSFSAHYFRKKFREENLHDHFYELFSLSSLQDFPSLLKSAPALSGLNITIPYKQEIIPYLDEISPAALKIGAVNTIKINRAFAQPKLVGYNTDAAGFLATLQPFLDHKPGFALILGSGGASKAVQYVLESLEIPYEVISRNTHGIHYEKLSEDQVEKALWIIQATPLGMHPSITTFPQIPYERLSPKHVLFDLVYNPAETIFLQQGKAKGAVVVNGLKMLHVQAEEAWKIWTA